MPWPLRSIASGVTVTVMGWFPKIQVPGAGLALVSALAPTLGISLPVYVRWGVFLFGLILIFWPLIQSTYTWTKAQSRSVIVVVIVLLLITFVTIFYMFKSFIPNLNIGFEKEPDNYKEGFVVAGIPWNNMYSGITLHIANDNIYDYANVDLTIQVDMLILEYGIVQPLSECKIAPSGMFDSMKLQLELNINGKTSVVKSPVAAKSSIIRLHCDHILSKSYVELTMALVNLNRHPQHAGEAMFLPRVDLKWVDVGASFDALQGHWNTTKFKCFDVDRLCQNLEIEKAHPLALGSSIIP